MSEALSFPQDRRGSDQYHLMKPEIMPRPLDGMCRPGSFGREYWDCYRRLIEVDDSTKKTQSLIRHYLAMSDLIRHANYRSLCLGMANGNIPADCQTSDIETHDPVSVGQIIRHFKGARQLMEYLTSDSGTGASLSDIIGEPSPAN